MPYLCTASRRVSDPSKASGIPDQSEGRESNSVVHFNRISPKKQITREESLLEVELSPTVFFSIPPYTCRGHGTNNSAQVAHLPSEWA